MKITGISLQCELVMPQRFYKYQSPDKLLMFHCYRNWFNLEFIAPRRYMGHIPVPTLTDHSCYPIIGQLPQSGLF
jgi:hypothetical protein